MTDPTPPATALVAQYAPARYVPAHATNFYSLFRDLRDIQYIVIHITDGRGAAQPVVEMWQQPYHGSSAHFVIDQDGTVLQAVLLEHAAIHAHAINRLSVGIEHCSRTPGEFKWLKDDPGLPVSDAQYASSAKLVAWLCMHLGLVPSRQSIQGHADIDHATTHRDCPDAIWDWDRYMTLVNSEYAALSA